MARTPTSPETLTQAIATLEVLPKDDLRRRWQEHYGTPPPKRLGRDLLLRGVSHAVQAKVEGGLEPALKRRLRRMAQDLKEQGDSALAIRPPVKPGTRLIRQWNGGTHEVTVLETGYVWRGQRYPSLSRIAREITGTRWSGPAFFGLTAPRGAPRHRTARGDKADA